MQDASAFAVGQFIEIHQASVKQFRVALVTDCPSSEDFREFCEAGLGFERNLDGQLGQVIDEDAQGIIVRTFEGFMAQVAVEHLKDYQPPEPENGGFDVAWPSGLEEAASFGSFVAETVARKGYCVVQTFLSREEHEEARRVANGLNEYLDTKEELEVDYLGRSNYTKVKRLTHDSPDRDVDNTLYRCDRQITEIGVLMSPLVPSLLGFEPFGRSASLARLRYSSKGEAEKLRPEPLDEDDVDEGVIREHITFVQSRKLCMLYMICSDGGEITLHPNGKPDVMLPVTKNRLLVFRHDRMTYTYSPLGDSVSLQSWMIRDVAGFEIDSVLATSKEKDEIWDVSGPHRAEGMKVQIMSCQTRYPGDADSPEHFWGLVSSCTDGALEWPFLRFDTELYYTTDQTKLVLQGLSYTKHGGFLNFEQVASFGNTFFGISDAEASCMSYNQRNTCEVGYDALYKAGWTRESINGKFIGTYLGDVGSDWHSLTSIGSMNCYDPDWSATGLTSAVAPTRLAHIFNLAGPTMTFDTACSASLVAIHHSHINMINNLKWEMKCDGSLCAGTNTLAAVGFMGNCQANMLSHLGRSFTYDRTADGYQRGEGTAAMFTKMASSYKDHEDRLAALCGSCANQDGRSASLTAPNGPSQQAVLKHSLRFAGITPEDLSTVECHGTGTALGDPIEVGAILAVMDGERDLPLPHTSTKSNICHLESSAGITGVIKCVAILLHGTATPNVHLKTLNSHLVSEGFPQIFGNELVPHGTNSGYCGVSSFGFGGTNARGDVYAKCISGIDARVEMKHERLDLIAVPCPKCMGQMCWKCGVAVPAFVDKKKHHCELLRDEFADYEYCSQCYAGEYRYGTEIEDLLKHSPDYTVSLVGTWNAWTKMEEMEQVESGIYVGYATLGETRLENFQLVVQESWDNAIYPAVENADMSARVNGPDSDNKAITDPRYDVPCQAKSWRLDGREEGSPSGTVYKITFDWGDAKKVTWEIVTEDIPAIVAGAPGSYEHAYYISASWNQCSLEQMRPCEEEGVYEANFLMGGNLKEEFHILRDRDTTQCIYPAVKRAEDASVATRGPDINGSGTNWRVHGAKREAFTVRLFVADGTFKLTVFSGSSGTSTWESSANGPYHNYYVTGQFAEWKFVPMIPDGPGIFRYRMTLEEPAEGFQIVVDGDREKILHPKTPDELCGLDFAMGPDDQGHGLHWLITGLPGSTVEIVVDLRSEDKRKIVSWRRVIDSMLEAPAYYSC